MFIDKGTEHILLLDVREHIETICVDCDRHGYCNVMDLMNCLRYYLEPLDADNSERASN